MLQSQNSPVYGPAFLAGGGEMGQLIRAFDWAQTELGPPDTWPQSLRTTLSIILNSKFPMFLFWGSNHICFYNDAYRPSLGQDGKHPALLGAKGVDGWQEIWAFISPIIDTVLAGGEATFYEDQLLPIYRNGKLEDVYWTFSYSPVSDETGKPAGVFVTCSETTGKVIAVNQLKENNDHLLLSVSSEQLAQKKVKENERNLRLIILQAPVAIAIFRGENYVVEIVNARALELWGRKFTEVANKPILESMPELLNQGVKDLLDHVYQTGEPFVATELPVQMLRNGEMETAYVNFVYEPLYDLDGQINGLITIGTEVTQQVLARQQIEMSEADLQSINEELLAANEELTATNEELGEAQISLQRAEEMVRFSVEAANAATWYMDAETREFIVSDRLREIFGLKPDAAARYEDILDRILPEYQKGIHAAIERSVASGQSYSMEHPIIGDDGTKRWVRALGKLYPAAGINNAHFSGLIIDITEQKQDEMRKNDFIGMVSHELKTPLTSLTAIVQVLNAKLKTSPDAFISGALDKANTQVKRMGNMINGFLNISRLESGKILIEKQPFDIDKLINEMIDEIKVTSSAHVISMQPCGQIKVNADRNKIGSVISNLLSNAVKYSPKGKKIDVACKQLANQIQVSITDEGMGIKPQDLEKLFDRYYRVESKHTAHISGFGIGLYLSAEIIHHHDGRIWVESESGKGSTFYFTLPA